MQMLIAQHGWGELVASKKFEADKALMAVDTASNTFLKSPTHKTMHDVFAKPTATLATVKKYMGEETMLAALESLIKSTAAFLNVGKGMSEFQVAETARMIFDEYYYLTLADFKVCLRNGMMGKFGQLYDRLDGNMIFDWLEQYDGQRAQYAETSAVRNLKEKIASENATHMPEKLSQWLRDFDEKKKKVFQAATPENAAGLKFWNLTAFLDHIKRNTEADKNQLWQLFEKRYMEQAPILEFEAYAIYQTQLALFSINKGEVTDWETLVKSASGNE